MNYLADPGGVFASDAHRRVLGHLTDEPMSAGDLLTRMDPDDATNFTEEGELVDVLKDLEADGHASQSKQGWKQTKRGLDALRGV